MTTSRVHKDEIDWLISVYKTSEDDELIHESLVKLMALGLNEKQINERFELIKSDNERLNAFNSTLTHLFH